MAAPSVSRLRLLSTDFKKWTNDQADEWWNSKSASEQFDTAQKLTTYCLDDRQYVAAYVGSWIMFMSRPSSPTSFMYAGDVFFNVNVPFFAFDFYTLSSSWRDRFGPGEDSSIRIDSRVGDAFEEVGDVDNALQWYSRVEKLKFDDVPPHYPITFFRTKPNYTLYKNSLSG